MRIHHALLKQARELATRDRKRPNQVNLRRAVSSAYYSLFHLLIDAAVRRLLAPAPLVSVGTIAARAFSHGEMKKISKAFASGSPPTAFAAVAPAVPQSIRSVAQAFVDLQQARHDADYDLRRSFSRREALAQIQRAEAAFSAWKGLPRVRPPAVDAYLAALLFGQLVRTS